MNWRIIDKSKTLQPDTGKYSDWKADLAKEGYNQCVYCSIRDFRLGGSRNFHVEHYKPKSKFPALTNTITNLFYACPICNVFKSNDWHDDTGNFTDSYYPDPSVHDYSNLFGVDDQGVVSSKNNCGQYIIVKLALNRNQLIIDRQFSQLLLDYEVLKNEYRVTRDRLIYLDDKKAKEILIGMIESYERIIDKTFKAFESIAYEEKDTQK